MAMLWRCCPGFRHSPSVSVVRLLSQLLAHRRLYDMSWKATSPISASPAAPCQCRSMGDTRGSPWGCQYLSQGLLLLPASLQHRLFTTQRPFLWRLNGFAVLPTLTNTALLHHLFRSWVQTPVDLSFELRETCTSHVAAPSQRSAFQLHAPLL